MRDTQQMRTQRQITDANLRRGDREDSKAALKAMLTEAVRNTASMQIKTPDKEC